MKDNLELKETYLNNLLKILEFGPAHDGGNIPEEMIKTISKIPFYFRNDLEKDLLAISPDKRPLNDLLRDATDMIARAKETSDYGELVLLMANFPIILRFLSRQGFYNKANELIKEWDDVMALKGGQVSLEYNMTYQSQKAFNYILQDMVEGIYLSRQLIDLLDNPLVLKTSPGIKDARDSFINAVHIHNKTGLPLFEDQ